MIGNKDNNDGQKSAYHWATTEGLGVKTGQPDKVCELCGQKEPEEGKLLCAECLAEREED